MRDRSPNSDDIMKLNSIPARCEHNATHTSKERTGKVGKRCLACKYGWLVCCKRRIDVGNITREGEDVKGGDIEWEEKHTSGWHARDRGYQHLVDCVRISKEID
jgi:hypothetical protein